MSLPQEKDLLKRSTIVAAIECGQATRAKYMREARQGLRTLDFVKIRQMDEDIKLLQKRLEAGL